MIAKITRGTSFSGVLNYLLEERDAAEIIGGNMEGRTPAELAREFRMSTDLGLIRADTCIVQHVSISLQIGEDVDGTKMCAIVARYLPAMGFDLERNQYVIVRHGDRPHPHCHVVVSRKRCDTGRLVPLPHEEFLQSQWVCRAIEREMGLLPPRVRSDNRPSIPSHTYDTRRGRRGRRRMPATLRIGGAIRWAARARPTMTEFLDRLQRRRVYVRPVATEDGNIIGISYRYNNVAVRGQRLGQEYTWPGLLLELGVRFDAKRDLAAVRAAAARAESAGVTPYLAKHRAAGMRSGDTMRAVDQQRRRRAKGRKLDRRARSPRTARQRWSFGTTPIAGPLASAGSLILGGLTRKALENMDPGETEEQGRSR